MPSRYFAFAFVCLVFLSLLVWLLVQGHLHWAAWSLLLLSSLLAGIGLRDVLQTRHAILRNYPILARSIVPAPVADPDFRVLIGASTAQPYSASLFNISA